MMLVVLSLILFTLAINAQKVEIIETGEFHNEEVSVKSDETWLGLYSAGKGFRLFPSLITITKVRDLVSDNDNEMTGKKVEVLGQAKPIFLIRGKNFLQSREVPTITSHELAIGNNYGAKFSFSNKKEYRLKVVTDSKSKGVKEYLDASSKLVLSFEGTKQIIYTQKRCDDCSWKILWTGDLDSDGKLDMYIDLSDHYNVSNRRLFLSSEADTGELVKEVANFRTVGC